MGVTGLWDLLEPTGYPILLTSLSGKRLAIDASIWIYQFMHISNTSKNIRNPHIYGFMKRLIKLLYFGIKPVFVFDGGVPSFKLKEIEKRNERAAGVSGKGRSENTQKYRKLAEKLLQVNKTLGSGRGKAESQENSVLTNENIISFLEKEEENENSAEISIDSDLDDIDINDPEFQTLPIEIQQEILLALKSKILSKRNNFIGNSSSSMEFSKSQIAAVVKRRNVSYKLQQIRNQHTLNNRLKLSSDSNIEFILRKQEGKGDVVGDGEKANGKIIVERDEDWVEVAVPSSQPYKSEDELYFEELFGGENQKEENEKKEEKEEIVLDETFDEILNSEGDDVVEQDQKVSYSPIIKPLITLNEQKMILKVIKDNEEMGIFSVESEAMAGENGQLNGESKKMAVNNWPAPKSDEDRNEEKEEKYTSIKSEQNNLNLKKDLMFENEDISEEISPDKPYTQSIPDLISTQKLGQIDQTNFTNDFSSSSFEPFRLQSTDNELIEDIKELLILFGVPFMTAPMEAEAQCAHLESIGLVDGVISGDSDIFLFGGQNVYRHMFSDSRHTTLYNMKVFTESTGGLKRNHLIQLAFLLGSDYCRGINGIGLIKAIEIFADIGLSKENDVDEPLRTFIKFIHNSENDKEDREYLKDFKKDKFKSLIPKDDDFIDFEIIKAYSQPIVNDNCQPFEWKEINQLELFKFLKMKIDILSSNEEELKKLFDPLFHKKSKEDKEKIVKKQRTLDFIVRPNRAIASSSLSNQLFSLHNSSKRLEKAIQMLKIKNVK